MNNIDTIMYLLDWNRSEEEQKRGISMAREVQCLKAFFQPAGPGYSKSVWENCARILCERSDDELCPYTAEMLEWVQDVNWPGAILILRRLMCFSRLDMITLLIRNMVPALVAIEDEVWLASIATLLDNKKIKDSLSVQTVQALMPFYNSEFAKAVFE